jgi:kumamolisin
MKSNHLCLWILVCTFLLTFASPTLAQNSSGSAVVITPSSSVEHPEDLGVRAHTHILLVIPRGGLPSASAAGLQPQEAPPYPGYFFETPASLACVYQLVKTAVPGCNPNTTVVNPTGGAGAHAVVDAYDYPNAADDLNTFSIQFGLPPANFTVVYATGATRPPQDPTGGWELEEALDIEWSHAMSPNAKIFLVEAASNNDSDLLTAVQLASKLVASNGGGEVSMSWGGSEFQGEQAYDQLFAVPKVVYFASTGDTPGVEWPSSSPNVIASGGTSTVRNPYTGAFEGSVAWQSAGGGPSAYEPRPFYQNSIASIVGPTRGTPDVSFDSDPDTAAWVYDSFPYELIQSPSIQTAVLGWVPVAGTSLAAVGFSGIVNAAGRLAPSSATELSLVYSNLQNRGAFQDVNYGTCGPYEGYLATNGWDFCTGIGTDIGLSGK